ncbi:TonB-dependent receptor [Pseudoalteromonas tunicata]|uniref:TonB-dependent receptor plug domain-containing protein n=1 Tax=Pseudoalteromonas tunicata TaxID=314281 RepID=UPI00273F6A99|nr:TonB-dependent receptor [Pseudoalteromonas tunicata]MDP5213709.1 TonB-dependent receptor [Pseudoalteromonas tunicata]
MFNFKQSALHLAVGSTLLSGLAFNVNAAEEGVEAVERIEVTGSRIKRSDLEAATPVTVITADDMKQQGFDSVADVLRNTSFNTLGSYREQSGSSFGGTALVNLRGLGEDRTAVLINGRRVPGNAFTGTSAVDINTIPMSAVESIQILTDSASAVYGADAIGGVINIIMKKDFDGTIVEYNSDMPSQEGGDRESFKITTGSSNDKSSVLFSFEYSKKDHIADKDRSYTGLNITSSGTPRDGVDVSGANGGGNSGFDMDFTKGFTVGECKESFYLPVLDPFGVPGTGCGYIFSDVSYNTMDMERFSTFVDARRQLSDDHEIYFESRISKVESSGRFAPAIGGFGVAADAPINPVGEEFLLYHRFVAHGPRNDTSDAVEIDAVLGFNGAFSGTDIEYDLSFRKYKYDANSRGENYVLKSNIEALVKSGAYNYIDPLSQEPGHLAAIAQSNATVSRDLANDTSSFLFALNGGTGIELGFGAADILWSAGIEYSEEEYQDIYDAFREAQNVLGSAGNSASGDRKRKALFGELLVPVLDGWDINMAVRYDDYNDFGSEVSPSISTSFVATEWLKLRASYGQGFKAPNLTNLYAKPQQSFEGVVDTTRCRAQGIADKDCPSGQQETYNAGNKDLKAETSESYNVGIILEPVDNFLITADYYSVELENVVTQLEFRDVFELEQQNNLPAGVVVNRGPTVDGVPGSITRCIAKSYPDCGLINPSANLATRKVEGLDFKVQYLLETSIGDFRPDLQWSHIKTYEEEIAGVLFEQPGKQGYPANRANFNFLYEAGNFKVNYAYQWIDETESDTGGKFEAWDIHSINMIYTAIDGLDLTFGVRNLTDEDPSIDTVGGWQAEQASVSRALYSLDGRVYTLGIKYSF